MARINLLPWRTDRRKQREREFYMLLIASAVGGVFALLVLVGWMGARIDNRIAYGIELAFALLRQRVRPLLAHLESRCLGRIIVGLARAQPNRTVRDRQRLVISR